MELPERLSPPLPFEEFTDIIDVRAPLEFQEDHIPGAINLPVLTDSQRHEIGTLHATSPFEARRAGATLITENIHQHLNQTLAHRGPHFAPLIYCWRGQLRSQSIATILKAIGWRARVLEGGYKAWRKWLMTDLEKKINHPPPELIVLAGLTGCGKTRLLHALRNQGAQVLDLEGHANHKGSILGTPNEGTQPSQKLFESRLWSDFSKFDKTRPIFTEAESNRIGNVHCPAPLWKRFTKARVIQIELPLSERAKFLIHDYPHFVEKPQALKETLDGLRRLRGHEQVDIWQSHIDAHEWMPFVESILTNHYDLVYRAPGNSNSVYQKSTRTLKLPQFSEEIFKKSATDLIQRYC